MTYCFVLAPISPLNGPRMRAHTCLHTFCLHTRQVCVCVCVCTYSSSGGVPLLICECECVCEKSSDFWIFALLQVWESFTDTGQLY